MASDYYIVSAWQDSSNHFYVELKKKDGSSGGTQRGGWGELKGFCADSYTYQDGNKIITRDADDNEISSNYTSC